MKTLITTVIFFTTVLHKVHAQVAISNTNTLPNASAMLDVSSSSKGLLIPRIALTSTTDITTIKTPATSLLIYNTATAGSNKTAVTPGFYYYNGSNWTPLTTTGTANTGKAWLLGGNAGISAADNFIGTIDNQPLKFKVNNITSGGIYTTSGNIAFGLYSLDSVTSGTSNSAMGYNTLHLNKDGDENSAFGTGALYANVSGGSNVAIGASALASSLAAHYNTGVGTYSLLHNISGNKNVGLGYNSLYSNLSGSNNIGVGTMASFMNGSGNNNIAIGNAASHNNVEGSNNMAIGDSALLKNMASYNMGVGYRALRSNTTGISNTAIGADAMYNNLTGNQNTALGRTTLFGNTTGIQNTALGHQAARYNQSGNSNTAVGFQSLLFNVANSNNTAVGNGSLANTVSDNNTAVGRSALLDNTTGFSNTAVGYEALNSNTIGNNNTAVGYRAGVWGNSYVNATALGANAQAGCSDCVVLGSVNGYNGATASAKIGIGTTNPQRTLHINPNGNGGIAIGNNIQSGGYTALTMGISQEIGGYAFIEGIKTTGASYGTLALNPNGGFVGVRKTSPSTPLHIKQSTDQPPYNGGLRLERNENGNFWDISIDYANQLELGFNGNTKVRFNNVDGEVYTISDLRMKKDISLVGKALPTLMKLEAKSYHYKDNNSAATLSYGFIAQEVEQIFPDAVSDIGRDGMKAVSYQKLNIMAIKAIQEQQLIIESQNKRIAELESKMNGLLTLHKK